MRNRNLSTDLRIIGKALFDEGLCVDISPIEVVIGKLQKNKNVYNLEKLKFNIANVPNNTRPNVSWLEIFLDVQIAENICDENKICNPLNTYHFSIEISGTKGVNKIHSSWHLDFDNSTESNYVHPSFHLTYGGKIMKETDLGNVLLLPVPRIPHPPMDAILGIDFILSNFVEKKRYDKIRTSQYKAAIQHSQQQFWKPYILSLANHWCNSKHCLHFDFDKNLSKEFYPTLIG